MTSTTTFDAADFRNLLPRFSAENRKANQSFVDWLTSVCGTEGRHVGAGRARLDPGAEALDRPDPGHHQATRLEENLGAAAVHLTPDDLREIDRAAAEIAIQGARYPEHMQKMVGR